jgi:excisionase family DNA binding protein
VHLSVTAPPPCECDELRHRLARIEAVLWPSDRWLRTGEVCRRLGIPPTTLRSAITSGRVPAQKVRGRWEVSPDWFAQQAIGAAR